MLRKIKTWRARQYTPRLPCRSRGKSAGKSITFISGYATVTFSTLETTAVSQVTVVTFTVISDRCARITSCRYANVGRAGCTFDGKRVFGRRRDKSVIRPIGPFGADAVRGLYLLPARALFPCRLSTTADSPSDFSYFSRPSVC